MPGPMFAQRTTQADQKDYGFRTRAAHSREASAYKMRENPSGANSFGEKDEDPLSIDGERNIVEESKRFRATNQNVFARFLYFGINAKFVTSLTPLLPFSFPFRRILYSFYNT